MAVSEPQRPAAEHVPAGSPARATVVVVITLSILIVLSCQVWGFWSVQASTGERLQWRAAQAEREAVQKEWGEMGRGLQKEAAALRAGIESLKSEANAARVERDKAAAELAGVQKEQELARQKLNDLLGDHQVVHQRSVAAATTQQAAETSMVELAAKQVKLRDDIATITSQREQALRDLAQVRDELKTQSTALQALQKAVADTKLKTENQERALTQLRTDIDLATTQRAKVIEQRAEATAALVAARQEWTSGAAQHAQTLKALEDLKKQIAELQQQWSAGQTAIETNRTEVAEAEKVLQAKRKELDAVTKRLEDARQDEQRLVLSIRQLVNTAVPPKPPPASQPTITPQPVSTPRTTTPSQSGPPAGVR